MARRSGFSLTELVTVVALMAILVGAAYPTASFLFERFREEALRENLVMLRASIQDFHLNRFDDDKDGRIDEDARGDRNLDGFPGIRGVDDDGDLLEDEDWGSRLPFTPEGRGNVDYDYESRRDDDEDGGIEDEAFAGDLSELASKMAVLRNEVPQDPTTGQSAWDIIRLDLNNDFDFTLGPEGRTFVPGVDPVVRSVGGTYLSTSSLILFAGSPAATFTDGTTLIPLTDEDPRNGLDDDADGRSDEDAQDIVGVRSVNSQPSGNLTPYSSW